MHSYKVRLQHIWAFTNSGALVSGSTAKSRKTLAMQTEAALKLIDIRFKVSSHDALIAEKCDGSRKSIVSLRAF